MTSITTMRSTLIRRWMVVLPTVLAIGCNGRSCRSSSSSANTSPPSTDPATVVVETERAVTDLVALLARPPRDKNDPASRLAAIRNLMGAIRAADATLPTDTFDLQGVVRKVGTDPLRLGKWVAENTAWVPYQGVLRGARGVLMDRVGNSLDRALLLDAMLKAAGTVTRLARGTLSEAQAAQLNKVSPVGPITPVGSAGESDADIRAVVSRTTQPLGVSADAVMNHAAAVQSDARRVMSGVSAQIDVEAAAIFKAVGSGVRGNAAEARGLGSARDHWWVQWRNGNDWVDLDPAQGLIHDPMIRVEEVLDVGSLKPELFHEVEIRVVIEQLEDSTLREHRALSHRVKPSDLLGDRIELQHVPIGWPGDIGTRTPEAVQRFRTAVAEQREWLPVLEVGSKSVSQSSFTDAGKLNEKPGSKQDKLGAGDLFGAMGGGLGSDADSGMLTAEWIEYVVHSPGIPERVIRREVFDILGPANRDAHRYPTAVDSGLRLKRGLSLLGATDIVAIGCDLSAEFVAHTRAERMLANQGALEDLFGQVGPIKKKDAIQRVAAVKPVPDSLYALALVRSEWRRRQDSAYMNRPNIFARYRYPIDSPAGIRMAEAFDIVANEIGVTAPDSSSAFMARVRQGLLDTHAEALLTPVGGTDKADVTSPERPESWRLLRSSADIANLSAAPDISARMRQDIAIGYVILAPAAVGTTSAGQYKWWRVDPKTGTTLGMGDRGWGQSLVEYAEELAYMSLSMFACTLIAGLDKNGVTAFDIVVCAGGALAGTTGFVAAAEIKTSGMLLLTMLGLAVSPVVLGCDRFAEE